MMRRIIFIVLIFSSSLSAEIVSISSEEVCVAETDDCISTLSVKTTSGEVEMDSLMGPFFLSKVHNQVFDCGGNVLRQMESANILSEGLGKTAIQHIGSIIDCGMTTDQKYYWVAYTGINRSDIFKSVLNVYNEIGTRVYSAPVSFSKHAHFELEGQQYRVYIPSIP